MRLTLVDPRTLVIVVFALGYATWLFLMPTTSLIPGIAPRYETSASQFMFFVLFVSLFAGMLSASGQSHLTTEPSHLPDNIWLVVGWITAIITLAADVFYLRGGLTGSASFAKDSVAGTITSFAAESRQNAVLGVSSLNNLYPIPAAIGAMLLFSRRSLPPTTRLQALALFGLIAAMTLIQSALGFARLWLLFTFLIGFSAWIIQRRPRLGQQLIVIGTGIVVALAFVFIMELFRNVGLQAKAAGLDMTDRRIITLALLRLVQAYIASDVNNALIVLDCHPATQLISTLEVIARPSKDFMGVDFQQYGDCPAWTSAFGTINFLGLAWWDWGYLSFGIVFGLGFALQRAFLLATQEERHLSFAKVLLPNILLTTVMLTRTNYVGTTQFVLPAAVLLGLWLINQLGRSQTVR